MKCEHNEKDHSAWGVCFTAPSDCLVMLFAPLDLKWNEWNCWSWTTFLFCFWRDQTHLCRCNYRFPGLLFERFSWTERWGKCIIGSRCYCKTYFFSFSFFSWCNIIVMKLRISWYQIRRRQVRKKNEYSIYEKRKWRKSIKKYQTLINCSHICRL